MSVKIDSPRPPQVSRPQALSPVSSAPAKEAPAPSAAPAPISDGFERASPKAGPKAARLEGIGAQMASESGPGAVGSTSSEPKPYELGMAAESAEQEWEGPGGSIRTSGTVPPMGDIVPPNIKNMIDGLVAAIDRSELKNPGSAHKLANEISRKVELPEGVSKKAVDAYIAQKLDERMASEGIDFGQKLG